MSKIITIGESMVMMVADQRDALQFVTSYSRKLAGAESNVAIGLARLELSVSWISALGDDQFGRYIRNTIRGEGVDTSDVLILDEYSTGLLVKEQNDIGDPAVYYYRKDSAASHLTPEVLKESSFAEAEIFHMTGIFPALSATCCETMLAAVEMAKKQGVLVTFDPNIRLKLWKEKEAVSTLLRFAALSDLIMPGKKEAEMLLGTGEWEEVADKFHEYGNRYVVMKDGPEGAYYSHRENGKIIEEGYEKGFPVTRVIDTVGAGDGFAVGILSGLQDGLSLREAVIRGNAIGSMAVMVQGDSEGYPTRRELKRYLDGFSRSLT